MAQEKMVSLLTDMVAKFESIWEPWAAYVGIPATNSRQSLAD